MLSRRNGEFRVYERHDVLGNELIDVARSGSLAAGYPEIFVSQHAAAGSKSSQLPHVNVDADLDGTDTELTSSHGVSSDEAAASGGWVLPTAAAGRGVPAVVQRSMLHAASNACLLLHRVLLNVIGPSALACSPLSTVAKWLCRCEVVSRPRWGRAVPCIAWHPTAQLLAAVDCNDRICIYNVAAAAPSHARAQPPQPSQLTPCAVLHHEFHHQVRCVAWRPHAGAQLAAATAGGVCLWQVNVRGDDAAASTRININDDTWMTFLHQSGWNNCSALAFSPDGRLLAAAYDAIHAVAVWDVGSERSMLLCYGWSRTHCLRWSPCGSFLFQGLHNMSFTLWETDTWTSKEWRHRQCGNLLEAAWMPAGRRLLLVYDGGQPSALYLKGRPPSLDADMLPVALSGVRFSGSAAGVVRGVAVDASGRRMAVALGEGHDKAGSIAVYSVSQDPVIMLQLLCFTSLPPTQRSTRDDISSNHRCGMAYGKIGNDGALLAARSSPDHIQFSPSYFKPQ